MPSDPANQSVCTTQFCGLCNRLVESVLERDGSDRFRLASLQGGFMAELRVVTASTARA
jgi:predicted DCC family thiol-disulfide oxidoreductase YuxK